MAGLVIDLYIGFFVRWVILSWRSAMSRKWSTVTGTVISCHFEEPGYGGDFVVLRYKYKVNLERYQGEIRKPYMYSNYANAFVRHHAGGNALMVRSNPENPQQSFPVLA
jgi:hypothetical protein